MTWAATQAYRSRWYSRACQSTYTSYTENFSTPLRTQEDIRRFDGEGLDRYNCYISCKRFDWDPRKSARLRANPKRGIGFEEAQQIFLGPYYEEQRSDLPEQWLAIGWVKDRLYSVVFEIRENEEGDVYHLVTLWKATQEECELYEENL